MKKQKKRRDMKTITIMLFLITALVWCVMLFIKWLSRGLDWGAIGDDILSNILGILPPIIIFNFAYEYLTKQHMADEMSEQITSTLMSDPEAIDLFDNDAKLQFVKTTMETIVGEDSSDMVYGVIEPYVTRQYNIRKSFKYSITLRDYVGSDLFAADRYLKVYENLKYTKLFINDAGAPNEFHVGFFAKDYVLDKALRNNTYLFRENLVLDKSETEKLLALTHEELLAFIENEMQLRFYIDSKLCTIKSFTYDEDGFDVVFTSEHSQTEKLHSIEISFSIPQRKGHSEFLVSISEPTYSPLIQLSYPETSMVVRAFSFMNDGEDSLLENATHYVGGYEFCIQNKWIYPMSGVVFTIDEK